ncbi:hypothetical protein [Paenibacillus sp. MBLB4367]|uniref:hypothetical protein n=1 Tax=Paenibacillus sp. MBLB4367 TaxID=3384767 RepID=UPI0039083AE7
MELQKWSALNEWLSVDASELESKLERVQSLISGMDISEQMTIHASLSKEALRGLFSIRDRITLSLDTVELVVWTYFKQRVQENEDRLNDEWETSLVEEYKASRNIALESLIIGLLKRDRIPPMQLERLESTFSCKAFQKEAAAFRARSVVGSGGMLSEDQVLRLMERKAYAALAFAMDNKALTQEALGLFSMPEKCAEDRKAKQSLFEKAQKLLDKSEDSPSG